jgi:hypothetical protein
MTRLIAFTIFGTLPLAILATLWSFFLFDRLLRFQFSDHRSEWERIGCPPGFFWVPPGAKTLLGGFSRGGLFWGWAKRPPTWVSHSERTLTDYRRFKRAVAWAYIVNGLFLVEFIMLLLSIFTPLLD